MCTSNNVYFSPFCFGAQVFNWATIASFIWNPINYLKWHWSWSKTCYYYSRHLAMMTTQMEGASSCIVQWSGNLSKTKRHPSQKRNKGNKAKKQRKWWLRHYCEARRAFILPAIVMSTAKCKQNSLSLQCKQLVFLTFPVLLFAKETWKNEKSSKFQQRRW